MRRGDIVESEDAPAETEEEERAEGNEGPEGELLMLLQMLVCVWSRLGGLVFWRKRRTTGTISCWTRGGRGMSSRKRAK